MTLEEQQRIRRLAVESEEWRRRKAEVIREIQDLDARKHVALGLLRSIESEEAKVRTMLLSTATARSR